MCVDVCVFVCVYARARARVCVCMCFCGGWGWLGEVGGRVDKRTEGEADYIDKNDSRQQPLLSRPSVNEQPITGRRT